MEGDSIPRNMHSLCVRVQFKHLFRAMLTSVLSIGYVSSLLVKFALNNKGVRPAGWVPRVLKECGIPYSEIWDILHEMYESQVCHFYDPLDIILNCSIRFHHSQVRRISK